MLRSKGQALLAFVAKRLCSQQASSSAVVAEASSPPSALFVQAKYCYNVTPAVIPYYNLNDLDIEKMRLNLNARGLEPPEGLLTKITESGEKLLDLEDQLAVVLGRKDTLLAKLQEQKSTNDQSTTIEELQSQYAECKKAEKELNNLKWEIEDECVLKYLDLPNDLHPDTVTSSDDVPALHSKGVPGRLMKHHQEICHNDLSFTDHGAYMSGQLASLELGLSSFVQEQVLERGFEMVAGTDFARSVIVEGCHPGSKVVGAGAAQVAYPIAEASDVSDVHGAMGLHLVGSASLYTFVSQLVKTVLVNKEALPLRQFSVGRNYQPIRFDNQYHQSLFQIPQTTALEAFTASQTEQKMEAEFEALVETLKTIYDKLDCHYKMSVAPANRLDMAQSKRVVVEMAAANSDGTGNPKYVEVANVAVYGDFLSNRLMLLWGDGRDGNSTETCRDLQIASGTLMNVTKTIGCLVESHQGFDRLPKWLLEEL